MKPRLADRVVCTVEQVGTPFKSAVPVGDSGTIVHVDQSIWTYVVEWDNGAQMRCAADEVEVYREDA